jgi:hypothetical protein
VNPQDALLVKQFPQPVTFYLDDLAFEPVPLERTGLLTNGGFEGELIPWQMGDLTREGEATLDDAIGKEGQSSLRLSAPPGQTSRAVEQAFEVEGGHWYRLSLWMRTQEVRGYVGAQVVLGGLMTDDRGIRLAGTHDYTLCAAAVMATLPFVPEVCVGSEILDPHSEDDPSGRGRAGVSWVASHRPVD